MNSIKQYTWILQILGAALLFGLAAFLYFGEGEDIVVPFLGAVIIVTAVIRLVPFVKTQKNDLIKTINIMEITIDMGIGLTLIVIQLFTEIEFNSGFGYLIGVYLMLRGAVHFFGVSEDKEKSDLPLYLFHVAALIVGSYVFFQGDFTPAVLINIIILFSAVAGGYFSYGGYTKYRSYRYQKTLSMPDSASAEERVEKRVPTQPQPEVEKEERIQDHIS
jgi:uncharacterized membrane protein HdeD (DUF308 family)